MNFKMILASVKAGLSDSVVDAAKNAGATGATIIQGRGTGVREAKTFFGLSLEAQTDIVMFLVEEHFVENILEAVGTAGKFHQPGTGIAFVVPVEHVIGLESQLDKLKEKIQNKNQ